jgi:hypothetical protein
MKDVDCARHGEFGALERNFLIASSNLNFGYPFKTLIVVDRLVPQRARKIIANLDILCRRAVVTRLDISVEFALNKLKERFARMETHWPY